MGRSFSAHTLLGLITLTSHIGPKNYAQLVQHEFLYFSFSTASHAKLTYSRVSLCHWFCQSSAGCIGNNQMLAAKLEEEPAAVENLQGLNNAALVQCKTERVTRT